jgi:hypothetical protein
MTESRILWLALGVFVGFVIWGERHKSIREVQDGMWLPDSPLIVDPLVQDQTGFAPASCQGSC